MIRNLRLLYPFLFVILPVLKIMSGNPGGATLSDVAWVLAAMLAGCAAVYAVVALATGARWANPTVSLIVLALVLWFYAYEWVRWVYRTSRDTPAPAVMTLVVVAVAAAATVAGLRWVTRRPRYLDRATTFFVLTGVLLVLWSGTRIISDQLQARSDLRASSLTRELSRTVPLQNRVTPDAGDSVRDIYLLVLDEYANSRVLQERFEFDNREMEDSLRQLGFTIPKLLRSNYVHTSLSLASLLNFTHLTRLTEEVGAGETDPTVPNRLVESNRTLAFLKARGYKVLFFPSQWWISTEHNRNADWEFQAWSGFRLGREIARSHLRRVFVDNTPLTVLRRDFAHDADHVKRTIAALKRVPSVSQPTFALAHLLNPHHPYVFDAECRSMPERPLGAWDQRRRDAYIDQVRCLNSLLLDFVTMVLQHSSPSPIILIVGDHGTSSLRYNRAKSAEAITPAQARERLGTFGAFYLPGGGSQLFTDSVTLVNVLPKVLNHYFDAGIPLAPDSLYLSLEQTPYLFVPVDPASLSQ